MAFLDGLKKAFYGEPSETKNETRRMTIAQDPNADEELSQIIEAANSTQNPEWFVLAGLDYENGEHVPKNQGKALQCYKIAADMDDPQGCNLYATLIYDPDSGRGLSEAGEYLKKAACMEHVESMYKLGLLYVMFHYGLGAGKGYDWWMKAAKLGYARAQVAVGNAYAQGKGYVDEPDHRSACFWHVCAYLHGNADVKDRAQEYLQWAKQKVPGAERHISSLMLSIPQKYPKYLQ